MPDAGPRHTYVTSEDDTAIAVTVTGRGRPLVIFPGSLSTARDWQLLADILAPQVTTYAIDRRGHGDSGDSATHSIEREQKDIAAVLDFAGPNAILLGHSYGAVVALGLAMTCSLAGLILYEPPLPLDGPVGGDALPSFQQAVNEGDLDHALALGLANFVKLPESAIKAIRHGSLWSARASMTPTWAREVRALDACGGDLERYATVDTPTLLAVGELSPKWLTNTSRRLHHAMPNAGIVELSGQAHEAYHSSPGTMAEALLPFISELPE